MIYPKDRFSFTPHATHKKNNYLLFLILIILGAGILSGAGYFLFFRPTAGGVVQPETPPAPAPKEKNLIELWKERDYDAIILLCRKRLEENPLDSVSLVFLGFSSFYKGATQVTFEDKLPLLELSIQSLRKVRLLGKNAYDAEIDYVLGKAYFQKGKYFADLSVEYIEKSLEKGYRKEDSLEYLGLAYSQLGRFEKSVEYFEQTAAEKPSDLIFYTLAQTYLQLKKQENAENYLRKAIEDTVDADLIEKCRSLLGEIYVSKKEFDKAEAEYAAILEKNPRSAGAHFALGEIYLQRGTTAREKAEWLVKARSEWRATLRIDPSHYGARRRLY